MENTLFTVNNVWMMMCTALVFLMHLGFSLLEIGLTRQKNTINILFKNVFILSVGVVLYALVGFNLMYPGSFIYGILPDHFFSLFGLSAPENGLTSEYNVGYTYWTDFLFQGMFAATAATIVSGAVAERVKLGSFMILQVQRWCILLVVGLHLLPFGYWEHELGNLIKMAPLAQFPAIAFHWQLLVC